MDEATRRRQAELDRQHKEKTDRHADQVRDRKEEEYRRNKARDAGFQDDNKRADKLRQGKDPNKVCFIATAACGDYLAPEVARLSSFRDEVLLRSRAGRRFVEVYYAVSPPVARFIGRSHILRRTVRAIVVRPLAVVAQRLGNGRG